MEIDLKAIQCQNYTIASSREWLITNGLGGYASCTVAGANTRRYHGLLVAALHPPTERYVLLSKVEERVRLNEQEYLLSSNQYVGAVFPQGYLHLERFELYPVPTFTYRLGWDAQIIKQVFMAYGRNTVYLTWRYQGDSPIQLVLAPLIAFKFYHHEMQARPDFPLAVDFAQDQVQVIYERCFPPLHLLAPGAALQPSGYWYYRFEHLREMERGLDCLEDLYNPVLFYFHLRPGEQAVLIGTVEGNQPEEPDRVLHSIRERQQALLASANLRAPFARLLVLASDAFCVRTPERAAVIAGYHWFTPWTRDTLIALPGLCLITKRYDFAREVLDSFLDHLSQGMLPNRFPDHLQPPDYNQVDGTLWYFYAVHQYLQHYWDREFAQKVLPALQEIIAWHQQGTRYNIHVDEDGLLYAGEPGVQLTWMDAVIGSQVVTPRIGKPVEVNALWINALRVLEWLEQRLGGSGERYGRAASAAEMRFREAFWYAEKGYFYDVLTDDGPDDALRPNQLLAISLPFAPATLEQARSALLQIQTHLLTPFGLRTLSPDHPTYRGRYGGPPEQRDAAYHQGTVWAWLLGPFLTAYVKVTGDRAGARRMLRPMREHLREAGLGFISEIFEGDPPHEPVGCIAQAWSVAELLRTLVEDAQIR